MRLVILLAAAVLAATPVGAATEIKSDPAKRWVHKPTGVALPPNLAGLPRSRLSWFSAPEVDVAAEYWSADGNDTITVYLYRNVSGSVPIWADRARFFITNMPDKYGAVTATGLRPFTPRGQSETSGLLETYQLGKWGKSSALAVLPVNGFYAKVRVTSKTRDLAGIEALLLETINTFDWSSKRPTTAVTPIADCPQSLPQRDAAEPVSMSSDDRMAAGIIGGALAGVIIDERGKEIDVRPSTFCREPGQSSLSFGLYRPDGNQDRFMLAVHDGGRAISVGRNGLAGLIFGELKTEVDATARYSVSLSSSTERRYSATLSRFRCPNRLSLRSKRGNRFRFRAHGARTITIPELSPSNARDHSSPPQRTFHVLPL